MALVLNTVFLFAIPHLPPYSISPFSVPFLNLLFPDPDPNPDPDPSDPHVYGPSGSGSGSFYQQAKVERKTLIPTVL